MGCSKTLWTERESQSFYVRDRSTGLLQGTSDLPASRQRCGPAVNARFIILLHRVETVAYVNMSDAGIVAPVFAPWMKRGLRAMLD